MVSTAAFHARVRGSVPGLGGLKETKMFLPHPRVKVSIVGSLRDREVACSDSDRQGSNFESRVWRTASSQSSHHPQEVLLAQFSLYVHKGGLKPDSFHLIYSNRTKMTKLQRPLTLCFQTSKGGRITQEDILNELLKHVKKEDIKCIQLTADEGRITLFDENRRNRLAPKTVTIKGNPVKFQNPESDITNATIKDAPIELPDETVVETLSRFGRIVPQSMRRGKIRGTNILKICTDN